MAEEKVLIIGPGAAMKEDASWLDDGLMTCIETLKKENREVLFCGDEASAPLLDADEAYLEPVRLEYVARIIRHERPAWVIPYAGGHQALKLVRELKNRGVSEECRCQLFGCELLDTPLGEAVSEGSTPEYLSGETLDHYHKILWLAARDCKGTIVHLVNGEQLEDASHNERDSVLISPAFSLHDELKQRIEKEVEQFMTSLKMVGVSAFVIAIHAESEKVQIMKVRPYLDFLTAFLESAAGMHAGALQAELFLGHELHQIEKRDGWAVQKPADNGSTRTYVISHGTVLSAALHDLVLSDTDQISRLDTNTLLAKAAEQKLEVLQELLSRNEAVDKVAGVSGIKAEFLQELKKTCLDTSPYPLTCMQKGVQKEGRENVMVLGAVQEEASSRSMSAGCIEAVQALSEKYNVTLLDHTMASCHMPIRDVCVYNGRVSPEHVLQLVKEKHIQTVFLSFVKEDEAELQKVLEENGIAVKDRPRDLFEEAVSTMDLPHTIKVRCEKTEAVKEAEKIGWPVMIEGKENGRSRAEVIADEKQADRFLQEVDGNSVEVKQYLPSRMADVTAIGDGREVYAAGIVEEMERAGVNQADSIAVYPSSTLTEKDQAALAEYIRVIGRKLKVTGIFRVRFLIDGDGTIRIGAVHRGFHEDVPFLEKCTGMRLTASAMRVWMGETLNACGYYGNVLMEREMYCVRVPLFETEKQQAGEAALSLEKKSCAQAIGCDVSLYRALYKGMQASGMKLSNYGTVLATVADSDKDQAVEVIRGFYDLGFNIIATSGTAEVLRRHGIRTHSLDKISDGSDEIYRALRSGNVKYVINTREAGYTAAETDGVRIRRCAIENQVPVLSSLSAARALLHVLQQITLPVRPFRRSHETGNR